MIMKRKVVFQSVGVAMASAMLAGDKTKSERAFDRLTSLQDEWKGETGGVNTALIYTLTANCSALMEPVDGNHLIAHPIIARPRTRRRWRRLQPPMSRRC